MAIDWKNVKTAKVKTNGYKAINGYDITLVVKNGTLDGDKLVNETLEDQKIEGDQPVSFTFEHTVQPKADYVLPEEITDKDGNKIEEATITDGDVTYTPETLTSDVTLVATCLTTTTTTTPAPTTTTTKAPQYNFISYDAETDGNEYATGTVKVVGESEGYTEIEIVDNSVKDNYDFAAGNHFFVKTTVEDGQRRQLYVKGDGDTLAAIEVWVEITPVQ